MLAHLEFDGSNTLVFLTFYNASQLFWKWGYTIWQPITNTLLEYSINRVSGENMALRRENNVKISYFKGEIFKSQPGLDIRIVYLLHTFRP